MQLSSARMILPSVLLPLPSSPQAEQRRLQGLFTTRRLWL